MRLFIQSRDQLIMFFFSPAWRCACYGRRGRVDCVLLPSCRWRTQNPRSTPRRKRFQTWGWLGRSFFYLCSAGIYFVTWPSRLTKKQTLLKCMHLSFSGQRRRQSRRLISRSYQFYSQAPRWKLCVTVHEGRGLKDNQPDGDYVLYSIDFDLHSFCLTFGHDAWIFF